MDNTTDNISVKDFHTQAGQACLQAYGIECSMGNRKEALEMLEQAQEHYKWLYENDN